MLLTEAEARTKWCPFVRADKSATTNARAINRFQENDKTLPKGTHCIASDCMGWRWWRTTKQAALQGCKVEAKGYCGPAGGLASYDD